MWGRKRRTRSLHLRQTPKTSVKWYPRHHYGGVSMPANKTFTGVPSKLSHLRGVPGPHNTRAIENTYSQTLPPLIAKGLHLLTSPNNHMLLPLTILSLDCIERIASSLVG
ncbi:hypothetical protein F2Q69_00000251 [Brassica cretica]|uniref:Uncharacterized protein n=1 Tax=Brassica cretica TaxID=69181 RepID=A0A8S9NU00_BRACR|nr:hypothetical protein F2Q69_00000251 [Brassica cretica]